MWKVELENAESYFVKNPIGGKENWYKNQAAYWEVGFSLSSQNY